MYKIIISDESLSNRQGYKTNLTIVKDNFPSYVKKEKSPGSMFAETYLEPLLKIDPSESSDKEINIIFERYFLFGSAQDIKNIDSHPIATTPCTFRIFIPPYTKHRLELESIQGGNIVYCISKEMPVINFSEFTTPSVFSIKTSEVAREFWNGSGVRGLVINKGRTPLIGIGKGWTELTQLNGSYVFYALGDPIDIPNQFGNDLKYIVKISSYITISLKFLNAYLIGLASQVYTIDGEPGFHSNDVTTIVCGKTVPIITDASLPWQKTKLADIFYTVLDKYDFDFTEFENIGNQAVESNRLYLNK